MANAATIKVPVSVEIGGKRLEIGVLELDVKVPPSGRLTAPSTSEIKRALRKVR